MVISGRLIVHAPVDLASIEIQHRRSHAPLYLVCSPCLARRQRIFWQAYRQAGECTSITNSCPFVFVAGAGLALWVLTLCLHAHMHLVISCEYYPIESSYCNGNRNRNGVRRPASTSSRTHLRMSESSQYRCRW